MLDAEAIGRILTPWSGWYSAHTTVQSVFLFVHLAGMLAGGGVAFATDRETLRARRADADERQRQVATINAAHPVVTGGLAVAFTSGLLMLAADFEALVVVPVFWIKMGLLAMLLANGVMMARAGRRAGTQADSVARAWTTLQRTAITSAVLWFAVVASGVLMTSAA